MDIDIYSSLLAMVRDGVTTQEAVFFAQIIMSLGVSALISAYIYGKAKRFSAYMMVMEDPTIGGKIGKLRALCRLLNPADTLPGENDVWIQCPNNDPHPHSGGNHKVLIKRINMRGLTGGVWDYKKGKFIGNYFIPILTIESSPLHTLCYDPRAERKIKSLIE